MRTAIFAGDHPAVANSLNSVGGAYDALGRYTEALQYNERALEMRKALYQANHPKVAQSLASVGQAYDLLGRSGQARDCYQQALSIYRAVHSSDNPRGTVKVLKKNVKLTNKRMKKGEKSCVV